MIKKQLALILFTIIFSLTSVYALNISYGPNGESGFINEYEINFSGVNQVYELDGNLNVEGVGDWFGDGFDHPGIDYGFSYDITSKYFDVTYLFTNISSSQIDNIIFYSFLDADINGNALNDRGVYKGDFNLYTYDNNINLGIYYTVGTNSDLNASHWSINYADNVWLDINEGLNLNDSLSAPFYTFGDNYGMGLQFDIGCLAPWESINLQIHVEPVPEPGTILLLGFGLIGLVAFKRRFKNSKAAS
ncbi:hypothetical protein GMMP15_940042 [Candidatus Magnetomoraceae bacterium gMMP-15]